MHHLFRRLIWSVSIAIFLAGPAGAHEFWLEPDDYNPKVGQKIPLNIRVGQFFDGEALLYLTDTFFNFTKFEGGKKQAIKGLDGDDPAATLAFKTPGLAIITYYAQPIDLTFEKWEKFVSYLNLVGLEHIVARHRAKQYPETGVKEIYSRNAKLLLNVDGGDGADRLTGMPLELVAESNPYRLAKGKKLPVRLYYKGVPIKGVRITAIAKSDGKTRHDYRTDAKGRALIELTSSGPWLLSAVHMFEPISDLGFKFDAHWESLWASMVFSVPQ
jgi:uncharacterized GH25 family protein